MKQIIAKGATLVFGLLSATAFSANYTWIGDETSSWQDEASYQEPGKPGAGDTVTFAASKNATVTDADFDFVSSLGAVKLNTSSTVAFDVTGEKTLGCPVSCVDTASTARFNHDYLVKKGTGTLTLGSSVSRAYWVNIDVQSGALHSPAVATDILSLNVAEGAVVFIPDTGLTLNGTSFTGSGLVTNASESTFTAEKSPRIGFNNVRSAFSGTIGGQIRVRSGTSSSSNARVDLLGTANTFSGWAGTYGGSELGVRYFGEKGKPSSVGIADIHLETVGGVLHCLGTEKETTDRGIVFDTSAPATIDAGTYGGVTFNGSWSYQSSCRMNHVLYLSGSNTEENVFAGSFIEPSNGGVFDWSTYICKRGPGIWRLSGPWFRSRGMIGVEEGTLRIDSVEPVGAICSLGLGTMPTIPGTTATTATDPSVVAPYQVAIGGERTEGTLEYVGTADASCDTRPIGVTGLGRLRNATDCDFCWTNVFGVGEGAKVLALDGDSMTAENVLETVTNACGTLSIVKDGKGTWTLTGDQDYNGTVTVNEGTLVVRRPATHYTYFRFLVTQSGHLTMAAKGVCTQSASASHEIMMPELGFYDADGNRLNYKTDCTWNQTATSAADLEPGQIALDATTTVLAHSARTPGLLVDGVGVASGNDGCHFKNPNNQGDYLTVANPGTWCGIVWRAPEGAPEVAAYDFSNYAGSNGGSTRGRSVECYKVQGSLDGETWSDVTNVVAKLGETLAEWPSNGAWNSDGTVVSSAPQARPGKGFPVNTHLHDPVRAFENVTSVSVSAGSTLKLDSQDGGAATIKGLTIDPEKGAGTIDGFAFAGTGALNLTSLPASGSAYKFTLRNCTGFANVANWGVRLNGEASDKYTFAADEDGTITIYRKGMVLIVR